MRASVRLGLGLLGAAFLAGAVRGQATTQSGKLDLQPFVFAKGTLDAEGDLPKSVRTGKLMLVLAGDSTVTYNAGYASGLRSHFDKQLQVVDLSRGGRTTAPWRRSMAAMRSMAGLVMRSFGSLRISHEGRPHRPR